MRAAAFAAVLGLPLICTPSARAQTSTSVWDGVYTTAQADRGAKAYTASCTFCHGAGLEGTGEAPGLVGAQFRSDFDGLTVGDLFDRTRTSMPQDAPNSLSAETYADILAYIFKTNGFPAGQKELDHRTPYLKAIAFIATNPHPGAASSPAASEQSGASGEARAQRSEPGVGSEPRLNRARRRPAPTPPADLDALTAANKASGVLSSSASDRRNAPDSQGNPYREIDDFLKLPSGRTMGSTSAVAVDSKGHIWVVDRCGQNSCADSTLDPIMEFDATGKFVKAFGGGQFNFPHGFFIDKNDHLWVTDGRAANGKGADILEFDESGKLLRTMGKPGVPGDGPDAFEAPNAILVAPDGTIFVSDGHEAGPSHAARIMKFDANGKFLKQWGSHGVEAGHFDAPHCLAMDTQGHLYVGDRWNNRIQVFDQDGKLLRIFTQFGRPSGIYVDQHDILYVTDSESRTPLGYGYHPGWKRGIRVGSVKDGIVTAFIPDPTPDQDNYATSGGEGIWVDTHGAIYSAQVKQKAIVKYVKQ
jgi:sugar lactone lactonase YvrE